MEPRGAEKMPAAVAPRPHAIAFELFSAG